MVTFCPCSVKSSDSQPCGRDSEVSGKTDPTHVDRITNYGILVYFILIIVLENIYKMNIND